MRYDPTTTNSPILREARAKCVNLTQAHADPERLSLKFRPDFHPGRSGMKSANLLCMGLLAGATLLTSPSARAQNIGERIWTPPATGNFFPLSNIDMPPIPWCPNLPIYYLGVLPGMNGPCYGYDDSSLGGQTSNGEPPPVPEGGEPGPDPGVPSVIAYDYGPGDLWLEANHDVNNATRVDQTLHGTWATNVYQLQWRSNIVQTNWAYGEVMFWAIDGDTDFTAVTNAPLPQQFFRAEQGKEAVEIYPGNNAVEPPINQIGSFSLTRRSPTGTSPLTVYYTVSGSATMGVDYTSLTGSVTFGAGEFSTNISVFPIADNQIEFEESVTLTLAHTNGYFVDPKFESATISIQDAITNAFDVVVTNLWGIGIDYHPVTNALIVSTDYRISPGISRFLQIRTNIVFTNSVFVTNTLIYPWVTNANLQDEVKLAIVKNTSNGFTQGDMFFGTFDKGFIGWASADGTLCDNQWKVLTNETTEALFRGGFYVDQSGSFGGDVIAVTGGGQQEGGEVWRINSHTNATRLISLTTNLVSPHLEGVVTITNDASKWGPWAGKIITGAESEVPPIIFAISTNGAATYHYLGIASEDFDIVQPNQDLYSMDQDAGLIVRVSHTLLTNFWGDVMITQEGFGSPGFNFVRWSGSNFMVRHLTYTNHLEHSTFAPIILPSVH
jgi:Calx-beta domain